jgi:hypothetical protein
MTDYQDEPAPSDKPDTTTMTGAEFRRHTAADPEQWAEACYAAMRAPGDALDGPGRIAFLARWFRDYGEAVRSEITALGRLVPRQE